MAAMAAARRAPMITDTASAFDTRLFAEPNDDSHSSKRSSSSSSADEGDDGNAAEQSRAPPLGAPNEPPGACSNAGQSTGGSAGDASCSGGGNRADHGGGGGSRMAAVGCCPKEYPPLRRAQRLSYAMPSILSDISPSEGRQVRDFRCTGPGFRWLSCFSAPCPS